MHATFRRSVILLALALILTACTRARPTPEPTPIPDQAAAAVSTPLPSAPLEPQVVPLTNTQSSGEPATEVTTPILTPSPTPAEEEPEVFQYTVQPGDTLFSIAAKFGATVDELVEINSLSSDALLVGQPLYVPYVEGITAEGLPTPTPGPYRYTIQEGDTLSGIAARFGVNQLQIVEANGLLSPDALTVGAVIIIPGYQPPAETETGEIVAGATPEAPSGGTQVIHIVQPGEGLIGIAELYGVSSSEIAAVNNITNRNVLRVGQELIIPGITTQQAAAARGAIHIVQSGESLLGIALRYGVTVEEILSTNAIDNPDAIYIGQELIIPLD